MNHHRNIPIVILDIHLPHSSYNVAKFLSSIMGEKPDLNNKQTPPPNPPSIPHMGEENGENDLGDENKIIETNEETLLNDLIDDFPPKITHYTLPPPKTLTNERKRRFETIYKQVCDFITSTFPKQLERLDEISSPEDRWKFDDEKSRKKEEISLMNILQHAGRQKLKALLQEDWDEISLFHKWLKTWEEEE